MADGDRERLNQLRSYISANLDDTRGALFDRAKRRRLAEVLELLAAVRRDHPDRPELVDELADIHDLIVGARSGARLSDQAITAFRRAIGLQPFRETAIAYVFRGMAYFLLTLAAIAGAILVWMGYPTPSATAFIGTPTEVVIVAASGAAGAMISVAMRIGKFEVPAYWSPGEMVLAGFVRPLIGAAVGLFSYALIKGGLIPINVGQGAGEVYAFVAIAFASGFAERVEIDPRDLLPGRKAAPAPSPEPDITPPLPPPGPDTKQAPIGKAAL